MKRKKKKIEVLNSLDLSMMAETTVFSDNTSQVFTISFLPKYFLFPQSSLMMTLSAYIIKPCRILNHLCYENFFFIINQTDLFPTKYPQTLQSKTELSKRR